MNETWRIFEDLYTQVLINKGYKVVDKVDLPLTPANRKHKPDKIIVCPKNRIILISKKWQQVSGTAEEKIPFETIKLLQAVKSKKANKAYLILGGEGFTPKLKEFYLKDGLLTYINYKPEVDIISSDKFLELISRQLI